MVFDFILMEANLKNTKACPPTCESGNTLNFRGYHFLVMATEELKTYFEPRKLGLLGLRQVSISCQVLLGLVDVTLC